MSVRPSVRPCKPCNQTTGRNFEPKCLKFGTWTKNVSFGPGTKPIEIGYDRSIISPNPHTNVLTEKGLAIINPLYIAIL